MKKIILLSDLWGKERSEWVSHYISRLEKHFELSYYDCRELGRISGKGLTEEALHTRFINGGIERAVERLLNSEKEAVAVLGFSVGGYILWKACLSGLKTEQLFALSSTRLRYETEKPVCKIHLYYGENDRFRPESRWFEQMELEQNIYPNEGHELYRKREIAETVCSRILDLKQ